MRQMICLAVLVLGLISISGCETTQPQQIGSQTLQIEIEAGNAAVNVFDVWEQYFDINNDGIPDETDPDGNILSPPLQTVCRRGFDPFGNEVIAVQNTPWNYSVEISIIRAGTTVTQRLTTTEALTATFNMTPYSETSILGAQQPNEDCPPLAICNLIGRFAATHRIVIDSTHPDCPGSPVLGDPRMSGTLENPLPPPFTIEVEKGDTVLVKARKSFSPPEGVEINNAEPTLQGSLFLGGARILNLSGTSVSPPEQGAGISFSFTVN